jgi:HEAT repeat protein
MQDICATDLLLKLLTEPGQWDQNVIIGDLGSTKDPREVDTLLKIANDPEQRKGRQTELGEALVNLGDQRAAELIVQMIKKADNWASWECLRKVYILRS